jgi:hypothetical protein
VEEGSEVINHSYTMDLTLTRHLNKWWPLSFDAPILANSRSSLYEHDGKTRHSTHSFGLGDVRLTAYRWIFDPSESPKGNIQFGLGIKLATGDYKYQDFFQKNDSTRLLGPVDQSIQLGDGGTGFSTEMNAHYNLSKHFSVYTNCYYLINPREQNEVSTSRGSAPSATSILYESSTVSVPDQYMIRAGANYTTKSLTVSLGIRDECLPVRDLIGGSSGFRRPGYIISAEPGLRYSFKRINLYAYVPVALERNRTQSVPDKIRTRLTGVFARGDAAFADYTINLKILNHKVFHTQVNYVSEQKVEVTDSFLIQPKNNRDFRYIFLHNSLCYLSIVEKIWTVNIFPHCLPHYCLKNTYLKLIFPTLSIIGIFWEKQYPTESSGNLSSIYLSKNI